MNRYSLTHVADHALLSNLAALNSQDRGTTADLLAHIGEVDDRRLYLPAAYSSMHQYCIRHLHMSEDTSYKRIRVARTAREFPVIFEAVADGRLGLSAVLLLTPKLTADTVGDLLAAATHKTNAEIELLLAERFPQPDLPTLVSELAPAGTVGELAVRPVQSQLAPAPGGTPVLQLAVRPVVGSKVPSRAKATPLSPGRFAWQLTVDQETQDQFEYVRALLGHSAPTGDIATVLKRALGLAAQILERRKFAKCVRSRPRRGAPQGRYVPAEVRRVVFQRDAGQCTFVSDGGKRCEATSRLEFDHIEPVAKGGQSTATNMRLRCRPHNQYAADCVFGAGFMHGKRQQARRRAANKARSGAQAVAEPARDPEVIPWLRQLGFNATEANRGAARCAPMAGVPLEQRIRVALRELAPNCVRAAHSNAFDALAGGSGVTTTLS
jgi:5-methylcytosine-specific restriction endonuclease McrA